MSKFENISQIINLSRNFNRTLRHDFHDLMQDSGFTLPQLSVISILAKNGKQKVSEISEKMGLSDSTVSGILDRLEQKKIVERQRDRDDRRVVKIYLSKGSQQIYREFHRKREEYFAHLLKKLSKQEINDIIKGLKILNRVFCDK
ncbi:MAG: MarR family transcriptional regulator [Candidatus Caldatribacteriota bacterium]|nr:MarR family transcriptional regulator [Candidatus Caldatribacteriota bacterium]